jgi:acetoacetyl-CoA synthetase
MAAQEEPLWQPGFERAAATRVAAFMAQCGLRSAIAFRGYAELWHWSVERPEEFWSSVWDFCGVVGDKGRTILQHGERMPGARWFPEAAINYAENLLRYCQPGAVEDALVFWGEDKVKRRLTRAELYAQVSRFQQALIASGVGKGDCVAAYMPNMPETIVAMLAVTALGAIWTSASPDFGVQGVLDRFGQTAPKILLCVDGYWYSGKAIDCLAKNAEVMASLPSVEKAVVVGYLDERPEVSGIRNAVPYEAFLAPFVVRDIRFERVDFDHPLFILYSSGTTGVPKCIVHGHGGTLLQHLKEHQLHGDVKLGDRLFYFTTCSWMMWNWLASALASGAALLLFDGSPFASGGAITFDYADAEGITHFGTSAKFLDAAAKASLEPMKTHRLAKMRAIFSTGSPLAPEGFDYVYQKIKSDVWLASISGGTDIISCFALGSPILPVWRGELQCRGLGMAVDVFDQQARALRGENGELVCTKPFPSMPVGFWNDPDGAKYRAAYFERFPGAWCHGDFVVLTAHDGMIILGRSDTTLKPGGVRIGTAEIYRQVEKVHEVMESLVIGQDFDNDVRVVLFVKLREGNTLDQTLIDRIKKQIRDSTTPRHVPAKVVQVADIPRTKSGKIVELAVRDIVHGRPVRNLEALANPEALQSYKDIAELSF